MPSAEAMARSIGVVTKPRTSSALAPTYTVLMTTDAVSLPGYCRTESVRHAWIPAIRLTTLTTIATTGLRMKRSVKEEEGEGVMDECGSGGRPDRHVQSGRWDNGRYRIRHCRVSGPASPAARACCR